MASAVKQVLLLPELLEIILSHLSQRDLLLSQRVNTAFNSTIRHSTILQKALFFLADWQLEARVYNEYAACIRPDNNRLLLRAFPGCYPTVTLMVKGMNADDDPLRYEGTDGNEISELWAWNVCISFPADGMPSCTPAVHYPEASWRRMHLSQPPCTQLYLTRRWVRAKAPKIVRHDGITMGDFVTEVTEKTNWHQGYISSDRDWHFEGHIACSSIRK